MVEVAFMSSYLVVLAIVGAIGERVLHYIGAGAAINKWLDRRAGEMAGD